MTSVSLVFFEFYTYSRHFISINVKTVINKMMPTSDATTTNNHTSLKLFPGNSIYSSPDCSRDLGESHIWAAKHGCESFCVSAIKAVFGTKNDGNGGGGIDTIELGGGPTSKH